VAQVLGSGIFYFIFLEKVTYKFILHTYEALCGGMENEFIRYFY